MNYFHWFLSVLGLAPRLPSTVKPYFSLTFQAIFNVESILLIDNIRLKIIDDLEA